MSGKGNRKRRADAPAEDPRVPGGDGDQTETIAEDRDTSAVPQGEMPSSPRSRCGRCQTAFKSRNELFEHLRDNDARDFGLVESSDNEAGDDDDYDAERSVVESPPLAEDDRRARPAEPDDQRQGGRSESKPLLAVRRGGSSRGHPGTKVSRAEIKPKDLQWVDIGSGIVAKTFVGPRGCGPRRKMGPTSRTSSRGRSGACQQDVLLTSARYTAPPTRCS